MLTPFEVFYLIVEPFMPYLRVRVRHDLKAQLRRLDSPVRILDVGARKSHYTIGFKADVTLLDVPRKTALQRQLNLGITGSVKHAILKRRSNVTDYIVEDFLSSNLPSESFDLITGIEVIEHVTEDVKFTREANRLLKPRGILYLTTPNDVAVTHRNPDHVRQYTAETLKHLLSRFFSSVDVYHTERKDSHLRFSTSRGPLKLSQPHKLPRRMLANFLIQLQNRSCIVDPDNALRLIAIARKD